MEEYRKEEVKEMVENEFYEWWMNVDLNFMIENVVSIMNDEEGREDFASDEEIEVVGEILGEVIKEFRQMK